MQEQEQSFYNKELDEGGESDGEGGGEGEAEGEGEGDDDMNGRGGEAVFGATAANATPMALDHILAHVSSTAAGDEQIHAVITGSKVQHWIRAGHQCWMRPHQLRRKLCRHRGASLCMPGESRCEKIFNGLCIEQSDRNQFSPIHADTLSCNGPRHVPFCKLFRRKRCETQR